MSKIISKARAAASPAQWADKVGVAGLLGLGIAVAVALIQVKV
jgi:hypothetical protein